MLTSYDLKIQSLIVAICRAILCCILCIIFIRTRPCSFFLFNIIEDKLLIIIVILNVGVFLNYFLNFKISLIFMASTLVILLTIFLIMIFCSSKKTFDEAKKFKTNFDYNLQAKIQKRSNIYII